MSTKKLRKFRISFYILTGIDVYTTEQYIVLMFL